MNMCPAGIQEAMIAKIMDKYSTSQQQGIIGKMLSKTRIRHKECDIDKAYFLDAVHKHDDQILIYLGGGEITGSGIQLWQK